MDIPTQRVEEFLHQRIPLAKAMNCRVIDSTRDAMSINTPRFANTVEGESLFAGSIMTVGVFASWTLLQVALRRLDYLPETLLMNSKWNIITSPISASTEFIARCSLPSDKEWQQFLRMLSRKGSASVVLKVSLEDEYKIANLTCEYKTRDLDQRQS